MLRSARARYRLVAITIGLVLAVLLVELGLRASGMGFGSSPMEPDPVLHHVHPRNYTFRQMHPSRELGGFDIYYDREGRVVAGPDTSKPATSTPASCRVALMGDSFTEGGQVRFEESFAGLLTAAGLGTCEVRNYGVRSYSPAIYLVQWTEVVSTWKPTHAFVLLFGNDVREDHNYLATAVFDAAGMPTAIQGPSGGWLLSQLRKSYVARFARMVYTQLEWVWLHQGEEQWTIGGVVEENPDWPGKSDGLLLELKKRVDASGTQLVLMTVPSRYRLMGDGRIKVTGDFHQSVKEWSTARGFTFLDLFAPFERASRKVPLFFLQDIHFASEGHAVVAAAIARAYPAQFPRWAEIRSAGVDAAFGEPPADR